jgi:hypothetical protein
MRRDGDNMKRRERREEEVAALVIEACLPYTHARLHDLGCGGHDFDLVRFGESIPYAALEVTTATAPTLRAAKAAHARHVSSRLSSNTLTRTWLLYSSTSSKFGKWDHKRLRLLLAELERDGTERFAAGMGSPSTSSARILGDEFGIIFAVAHATARPKIIVSPPGDDSCWVSSDPTPGLYVVEAVNREAQKPDNVMKLERSGVNENHLFVWISEDNYLPWKDLDYGQFPAARLQLPNVISTAWAATEVANGIVVAWQYGRKSGWRESLRQRLIDHGQART